MKKLIGITALLLLLSGCNGSAKTTESTDSSPKTKVSSSTKKSSASSSKKESSSTKESSTIESSVAPVNNQVSNITPHEFLGEWYEIDGVNVMAFTETTSSAIENSEVYPENGFTNFSHDAQHQSDFSARVITDTEHGEVLELIFAGSDRLQRFSRTPNSNTKTMRQQESESSTPDKEPEVYTEVLAGEGPRQVAERNGISLEKLYELNSIPTDLTNWAVNAGQSLRVK